MKPSLLCKNFDGQSIQSIQLSHKQNVIYSNGVKKSCIISGQVCMHFLRPTLSISHRLVHVLIKYAFISVTVIFLFV